MRGTATLVVVLALTVGCNPSGSKTRHAAPATITSPAPVPLESVLAAITPPAGAIRVVTDPLATIDHQPTPPQYGTGGPGYVQLDRYWTTTATPYQAIAAVTAHAPNGLPGSPAGTGTIGGRTIDSAQYDAVETEERDGPHVYIAAEATPSGTTALSAHVWETVKPAKSADELVTGAVSSVDASISVFQATKPIASSVTGAAAQQLARDLNGLWVDVAMEDAGCGGSIYTATSFDLTFHASGGEHRFSTGCRTVSPAGQGSAPKLWESDALIADLQADFGTLLPAALQESGHPPDPPPQPQSHALAATLDQLTPPGGAKQTALPADVEASASGYLTQPGYAQAARAWTTTLAPEAAIAAMAVHVPAGLTGGLQPPQPTNQLPRASASYRAIDTATTLGPRLELEAEREPSGVTTIDALIWQIDTTAKPVRDRVTGSVESVTGAYSGGAGTPSTVTGATAQMLAFDLNDLLVNGSTLPPGCDAATAALTLTFQTSSGQQSFSDSCGFVRVLPAVGADPELQTSDAFNADVNTAFGSLVPSPLPSSAPLPTSPATQTAGKTADQVISSYPSSVTIEAVLPVGKGKQRETDQTFTVTGNPGARLVDDLRSSQVYTGPAPAGCQPFMRTTTIRVRLPGQLLTFVAFCVNVTTVTPKDPVLTFPASLEKDLDADLATLTPTRSVDPPVNSSLAMTIATAGTPKDKVGKQLSGTVTVSQDGVVIASKRVAAGQTWHLPVRQGSYTVAMTSAGHTCLNEVLTVPDHSDVGPSGICS